MGGERLKGKRKKQERCVWQYHADPVVSPFYLLSFIFFLSPPYCYVMRQQGYLGGEICLQRR